MLDRATHRRCRAGAPVKNLAHRASRHSGEKNAPSNPGTKHLGERRWPVERSNAWVLENKRLALRYDRLGFIIQSLLQCACIFLVAGRLARQF